MRRALSVIGAAASFSELSFLYFEAGDLRYWRLHRKAAKSLDTAYALALKWIVKYQPMLVIVPDYGEKSRKGLHARALIEVVATAAENKGVVCIRAERPRTARNKYQEAALLAVVFPQIVPRVPPPRKAWDTERRGILLFEALAVTHHWLWQNNQGAPPLPV